MTFSSERERQRVQHLVLGLPRPRSEAAGGEAKRRGKRRSVRRIARAKPVPLDPAIEPWVQLRERWDHCRHGTPETHDRARPGALSRLHASGAIDREQLEAAEAIEAAHRAITAEVRVRTASYETRVDGGAHGRTEDQLFGRVRAELTYDRWRSLVVGPIDMLLAVIVDDLALTVATRRYGMSMPRGRRLLVDALDLWWTCLGSAGKLARANLAAEY